MTEIMQNSVCVSVSFKIDFLSTLSGEMLSPYYRRAIEGDHAWLDAANQLKDTLAITHIIGRARKQKICLDQDYVIEKLHVDERVFTLPTDRKLLYPAQCRSGSKNASLGTKGLKKCTR